MKLREPGSPLRLFARFLGVAAALGLAEAAGALTPGDAVVSDAGASSGAAGLLQVSAGTGNRTVLTGQGVGSGVNIDTPRFVVVSPSGTVYYIEGLASGTANQVIAVNPATGVRTKLTSVPFVAPTGMTWDPAASLLIVTDAGASPSTSEVVSVNTGTGAKTVVTGNGSGGGAAIDTPRFPAVGPDGTVYYIETQAAGTADHVVSVNPGSGSRTALSGTPVVTPTGMTWDYVTGHLAVSDAGTSSSTSGVTAVNPSTGAASAITGVNGTGGGSAVDTPVSVTATAAGGLFYFELLSATTANNVISVAGGTRSVLSGSSGGVGSGPAFSAITGVSAVPRPLPSITSAASAQGVTGTAFSYAIVATNSPGAYGETGVLPTGLTFNAGTGVISGTPTQAGTFDLSVQATNASGSASAPLAITVNVAPPGIATQPVSGTVSAGDTAAFWVVASGTGPFTYQWSLNGTAVSGATGALFTLADVASGNAGTYTVAVTNAGGSITSTAATLTVGASGGSGPGFASEPVSQTVEGGGTVVFQAPSSPPGSSGPPTYQWFLNGVAIPGANSSTLVIAGATAGESGGYSCVVTNSSGSALSSTASLDVVTTSDPGRLINLSCRALSETGSNQMIAGFEIGGEGTSGSLPVLVRATGPTLGNFGVTGTLADPQLTLDQSLNGANALVATNTVWGGNSTIVNAANEVGAFSWASDSKDSALLEPLVTGAYTAQVTGAADDSGVALAEVYDATPGGSYTSTSPRLVNLSARVEVGTSGNILIAGFVVGGTTSKTVLIRGSGPVLAEFGLTGTLPDPRLSLFQSNSDGSNTLLEVDTGWGGDPQIADTAAGVGAFSWGTAATADSALLVTLPPGAYTAEVAGVDGDSGIALIEVYEVP